MMLSTDEIDQLAHQYDHVDFVRSLILIGSYARGDAGRFSDIDFIRFVRSESTLSDDGTHLHPSQQILINVSSYRSNEVDQWFNDPMCAIKMISGLRSARILIDRDNFYRDFVSKRLDEFQWTREFEVAARREAGRRMVGWCEEAHKGLEGLHRSNDVGRLLNSIHGLSWGLIDVLSLHYGILISSDNHLFIEVEKCFDGNSLMIQFYRIVFGVGGKFDLRQRVISGLCLFQHLVEQMSDYWCDDDRKIVQSTSKHIADVLPKFLNEIEFVDERRDSKISSSLPES